MGFRINTNVPSMSARRALGKTNNASEQILQKLSSGQRITKSADDAAGLAISEKMRAQIRFTRQADRNANDGISLIQTAEGGLNEISNILIRLREVAIQAASDTVTDNEREFSNLEFQNLKAEIQRIAASTQFNGHRLLNGQGETLDFQIGIQNSDAEDRISYEAERINASLDKLGIGEMVVANKVGAQSSLENIDSAITNVSGQRANLGAIQNRLVSTSQNLQVSAENLSQANSRIRDTDYAAATAKSTQLNILTSAGTSVLGQSNNQAASVMKLLG